MTSREKLNLFPSRANYVFVKQRMASAQKGLMLLKHKRDALEINLREYKSQLKKTQKECDETVRAAVFSMARLEYLGTDLKPHGLLNVAQPDVFLRFSFFQTIGVTIPQFEISLHEARSYPLTGLGRGGTEVPKVRKKFQDALMQISRLASIDYAVKVLNVGVHQNNMRLNGLEFVVLPRYQNTLNYIRDEMDEFEREDFYRLKIGQGKRLKKQQEEIENMRHKMTDPDKFTTKVKKAREDKMKNIPDWKRMYAKKLEAAVKAKYDLAQAKAAAKQQQQMAEEEEELVVEEDEEFDEEFDEIELEYDEEDVGESEGDNDFHAINHSDNIVGAPRDTLNSFAIDDPDSQEGSRERMETHAIITPPTPAKGTDATEYAMTTESANITESGNITESRNTTEPAYNPEAPPTQISNATQPETQIDDPDSQEDSRDRMEDHAKITPPTPTKGADATEYAMATESPNITESANITESRNSIDPANNPEAPQTHISSTTQPETQTDDPDSQEGSRERMESHAIITPPTPTTGADATEYDMTTEPASTPEEPQTHISNTTLPETQTDNENATNSTSRQEDADERN